MMRPLTGRFGAIIPLSALWGHGMPWPRAAERELDTFGVTGYPSLHILAAPGQGAWEGVSCRTKSF